MTDEVLHALTRILLRLCSPRRVYDILVRIAAFLPQHADRSELREACVRIQSSGTCLSRALAVVARAPDAELVIGVALPAGSGFFAHAWLEFAGEPIDVRDALGDEIVRLGRRS